MGYIQFATVPSRVIKLDIGEREDWGETIQTTDRLTGATYIEQAMRLGLYDWGQNTSLGEPIVNASRNQFTVLITDGTSKKTHV